MVDKVILNLPPGIEIANLSRKLEIVLENEITIEELFLKLAIKYNICFQKLIMDSIWSSEGNLLIILNNKSVYPKDFSHELVWPGDVIHIIPPISGG
ncbi:MAG: hypothetical protein VR72_02285 [Clostridiaceae bacterium BRH_c20a]|nr:MAG: hypothetical protein VR72_02285 [Clostridiaceae bacterium BRH_c20a]